MLHEAEAQKKSNTQTKTSIVQNQKKKEHDRSLIRMREKGIEKQNQKLEN